MLMIMTAQEVLNTVAQHLLTQGQKSVNGASMCRYRNTQGLKCAVGCLLTDDEYSPKMEGGRVDTIPHLLPARLRVHVGLMRSSQFIHDNCPVDSWPSELRRLAVQEGLNVPEGCR